jgi:hypothetical protein
MCAPLWCRAGKHHSVVPLGPLLSRARWPPRGCHSGSDVADEQEKNQKRLRAELEATATMQDILAETMRLQLEGGDPGITFGTFHDPVLIAIDVKVRSALHARRVH